MQINRKENIREMQIDEKKVIVYLILNRSYHCKVLRGPISSSR